MNKMKDKKVIIIDHEEEYEEILKKLDSELIITDPNNFTYINPLLIK